MRTLQNKRVTTIEGLSADGSHPVQRAWATHNVAAVRLLPDRPDHAGGGAAERARRIRPIRTSTAPWRATSAAAAPISASAPPSRPRRRRRPGMSRHRKRQPPPVPRRPVLDRRLRARRAGAARVRVGAGPGRVRTQRRVGAALNPSVYLGIEPDGTVFIVTHRSEMGTGIRTTLPLVAADELDADWSRVPHRAGHRRPALRRPEHRRLALDSRLLRRVPPRRRLGADDAGERGRGAVERAGGASARPRTTKWCTGRAAAGSASARWCPPRRSCRCPKAEDAAVQAEDRRGSSSARTRRSTT